MVIFLAITPFLSLAQENIDQLILNRQYEKALQQVNLLLTEQPSAQLFHKKGMILRETFD